MSQERRKFDKEFKLMTVELSKSRANLNELAKELGIRVELIYRWRNELLDKGAGSFPGHGIPKHTPEEAEIARLKKQLRDVEMERDILKKAINIFSRGDRKSTDL
jgi:transposase-like protein